MSTGAKWQGCIPPKKTNHCWASTLLFLQEENATVTSGGREDGATMCEQCGVSAQTVSMSQVSSRCMFWPPQRWFCRTHTDAHSYIDTNISPAKCRQRRKCPSSVFVPPQWAESCEWQTAPQSHIFLFSLDHIGYVYQIICTVMTVSVFSHSSEEAVTRVISGRGDCSSWFWKYIHNRFPCWLRR